MYQKAFIQNLVQIGSVVSEKIQFDFCMYTTLGQGQEMTLTFNSHISSNKMSTPTTFQVAAIVSEKIHCFHFFLKKSISYQI